MEHYVTLFDSLFLPQGIALHESLEKNAGDYCLWILCIDDTAFEILQKLTLPNVKLIKLHDIETPELLQVKKDRTRAEYCWTLTPFTPRFVFDADPKVQRVTYVDADLWLLKSPDLIFQELEDSGKKVLITEHAYAPEYDQTATSGVYCVQFMTFVREGCEPVRKWWEERCVEWCYSRYEDGKFGDQKYLDDWPSRFEKQVHVLKTKEWMLAPWNAIRFPYGNAIAYHFHGLRIQKNKKVNLGHYVLPKVLVKFVYEPYIVSLGQAINMLEIISFEYLIQQKKIGFLHTIKSILSGIYRQAWQFNVRHFKKIK